MFLHLVYLTSCHRQIVSESSYFILRGEVRTIRTFHYCLIMARCYCGDCFIRHFVIRCPWNYLHSVTFQDTFWYYWLSRACYIAVILLFVQFERFWPWSVKKFAGKIRIALSQHSTSIMFVVVKFYVWYLMTSKNLIMHRLWQIWLPLRFYEIWKDKFDEVFCNFLSWIKRWGIRYKKKIVL